MKKHLRIYRTSMVIGMLCGGVSPVWAATSMSDATMNISMTIADVTCQINNGQGLSQIVNMPLVYKDDIKSGRVESREAPLIVDCAGSQSQPNGITLRVEPAGTSILVGDGSAGRLKTDKAGVGLQLNWKHDGKPVSMMSLSDTLFTPDMAIGNAWDLGIIAKPIPIPGEWIGIGQYIGSIRLTLSYT